jgi:hypothetical protein
VTILIITLPEILMLLKKMGPKKWGQAPFMGIGARPHFYVAILEIWIIYDINDLVWRP